MNQLALLNVVIAARDSEHKKEIIVRENNDHVSEMSQDGYKLSAWMNEIDGLSLTSASRDLWLEARIRVELRQSGYFHL